MKPLPGQQTLFGEERRSALPQYAAAEQPVPCNPSVEPHDAPRLARQRQAIVARLQRGPATNLDLAAIAQRFGARLGEAKKLGEIKGWLKRQIKPGLIEYRLVD